MRVVVRDHRRKRRILALICGRQTMDMYDYDVARVPFVGRLQSVLRCWSTSVESAIPTSVRHMDCVATLISVI